MTKTKIKLPDISESMEIIKSFQKQDLPKTTDFEVYDSFVIDYIPTLFRLENELNLRCYQRDTDDPDNIYLCWYDQTNRVNIQLWREHGGRKQYRFIIGALFEIVGNKITDKFYLEVEPSRTEPESIEFIIRALVDKAKTKGVAEL